MSDRCQKCGNETYGTPYCTACGAKLPAVATAADRPVDSPAAFAHAPAPLPDFASFWARLTAFALDGAVIGFTALLLALAATAAYRAGAGRLPEGWWADGFFVLWLALSALLGVAYHASFVGSTGQTPGKAALGIAVADAGRRRLGYGRALVRAFAYELSWAPFQLGFLWALWDKKHQTWHDKIADTVVVRKG
jgi:uncharacterized RDD family membrane protein YckC